MNNNKRRSEDEREKMICDDNADEKCEIVFQ